MDALLSAVEYLESQKAEIESALVSLRKILKSTPTPKPPLLPVVKASRKPKRTSVAWNGAHPKAQNAPPSEGRVSPVQDACIDAIHKHGPLTSAEVFEKLQAAGVETTSGSVYQTLRLLREKKRLESREADDDGRVKWHLA